MIFKKKFLKKMFRYIPLLVYTDNPKEIYAI